MRCTKHNAFSVAANTSYPGTNQGNVQNDIFMKVYLSSTATPRLNGISTTHRAIVGVRKRKENDHRGAH